MSAIDMFVLERRVNETLERVTRMESRLVQLGDHVGANLRTKQRIEICLNPAGIATVQIDSLDVSISRILTELRQANVHATHVPVHYGDQLVFTLFPPVTKG